MNPNSDTMLSENGSREGAFLEPKLVGPNVISSSVLGLTAWWLGSNTDLLLVRDLVVRNFKAEEIYCAWSKLREALMQSKGEAFQAPTKHRSDVKLAEEMLKDI